MGKIIDKLIEYTGDRFDKSFERAKEKMESTDPNPDAKIDSIKDLLDILKTLRVIDFDMNKWDIEEHIEALQEEPEDWEEFKHNLKKVWYIYKNYPMMKALVVPAFKSIIFTMTIDFLKLVFNPIEWFRFWRDFITYGWEDK